MARSNAGKTAGIRDAAGAVLLEGVVVIASPHGRRTGVYAHPRGDLDAFGPRGLGVDLAGEDDFTRDLAGVWEVPLLEEPADHGVLVPLRLLPSPSAAVAIAFEEGSGDGAALASALLSLDRSFSFVASANLSAGLTAGAPLPSVEGAAGADEAALSALRESPESLAELGPALVAAGSCAAPVLAAFGTLFAGRSCEVLSYDHPFGVGYAVAVTR